jgi:Phage capsid family
MEADFSGYATKAGLKCSDGLTIMAEAFKHMDGKKVPLVWQHSRSEPKNVLGHALLEARDDGMYAYGFFNETDSGKSAKVLVQHGDVEAMSIYANKLVKRSNNVHHGNIGEVSLVLQGANPGALIDYVNLAHADGEIETLDDEILIYTGLTLEHAVTETSSNTEEDEDKTVEDVYNSFTEEQKTLVHYLIGAAMEAVEDKTDEAEQSSDDNSTTTEDMNTEETLTHKEGTEMGRNVFDQTDGASALQDRPTLTHDQLSAIVSDAKRMGSFKESFLQHAVEYGIENIDYLFPEARLLADSPQLVARKQEWVTAVMDSVKKSPFARIKTVSADITHDDARAKGYVKGSLKKEEWFALQKRVTGPTTVYKKQKLDRDDIVDITDLDVVAWLKAEMRLMLNEEIARAVLVGDGREIDDDDKIDESSLRPIALEADFYAHHVTIAANTSGDDLVEAILRARPYYRGTGNPTLFLTEELLTDLILIKDKMGRRLYSSKEDLAFTLRVRDIITVPVMESTSITGGDLLAILVNLSDYTLGADKGGQVSMFDDFDIDFNQFKYLLETRLSGALTLFKSALVFTRGAGTLATPAVPTFVASTGVVTIPSTTGVIYKMDDVVATAGAQTAIGAGESVEVTAEPASGYYFPHNFDADWVFTRDA